MATGKKKVVNTDTDIVLPTLQEDIQMKIDSLKGSGLDSVVGRGEALKYILEDVAGGHIDTDLTGAQLITEVKKGLGLK